jgi:hypothetical protein
MRDRLKWSICARRGFHGILDSLCTACHESSSGTGWNGRTNYLANELDASTVYFRGDLFADAASEGAQGSLRTVWLCAALLRAARGESGCDPSGFSSPPETSESRCERPHPGWFLRLAVVSDRPADRTQRLTRDSAPAERWAGTIGGLTGFFSIAALVKGRGRCSCACHGRPSACRSPLLFCFYCWLV